MKGKIDSELRAVENRPGQKRKRLLFKRDWLTYLHELRRREIEIVFGRCPASCFARGLELGAGDGFQSRLMARYVASLAVTDWCTEILKQPDTEAITHRVCDAQEVGEAFSAGEFDLVFSSNMLEHLSQPLRALRGIHHVLRDDGIAVHVMPSPFWKLCQLIGFYPNAVLSRLNRYTERWAGTSRTMQPEATEINSLVPAGRDNNPESSAQHCGYLRRLLWATPHGAAGSNLEEGWTFSPALWRRRFTEAGFTVTQTLRGPVSSGYGFGLDRLRDLLERCGLTSEIIYITHKVGHSSPKLACIGAA